jgi:hypothetical protein
MADQMQDMPEVAVESVIPSQLNYKSKDYASPKYKFTRIVPLSGSQTVGIPLVSTFETLFEIPTNVFNFAQSFLFADGQIPPPPAVANQFLGLHSDGFPFLQEIDLYTRSGIYLCQLPYANKYCKIIRKMHTTMNEYLSNGEESYLFPSATTVNFSPSQPPVNGSAYMPILESGYVLTSNMYGGITTNALNFQINIPLSAFKETIMACDKDLVFPDILVMRCLWGPGNQIGWQFTGANTPQNIPIPLTPAVAVNPAPNIGIQAITLYNLTLYLATERNEDLAQSVRAIVNSPSGLNVLIDYPYPYKNTLNGTSQSISLRLNRGHGVNLLEVVTSPFATGGTENEAYSCFNITNAGTAPFVANGANPYTAPALIQTYYSQLDNVRLQDITLNCNPQFGDDWRENRKNVIGTPYLSERVYYQNWMHCDRMTERDPCKMYSSENLDRGLSLIVERKYDIFFTTINEQTDWYSFAVVQKNLHIGSQMIAYQ